jgi:hypothetical protein
MQEYINAPVPFLMGMESGREVGEECVLVDLDKGQVHIPFDLPSLPAPGSFHLMKDVAGILQNAKESLDEEDVIWATASL